MNHNSGYFSEADLIKISVAIAPYKVQDIERIIAKNGIYYIFIQDQVFEVKL